MNMKHFEKHMLLCCALLFSLELSAQEFIWPMAGKKAGENIIGKPQTYVGTEMNFDDLFIGGEYGDAVISPVDGTITHIGADFFQSLGYVITAVEIGTIDQRIEAAVKEGIGDAKYTTGSITIRIPDGRNIHISGIYGPQTFLTGQKIAAGDTLGLLGYSYKGFNEPSLMFSVSSPQSKPSDPMKPFGLASTFKEPEKFVREDPLSVEHFKEDLTVLEEAVLDAYPSLDALMSEEDFRAAMDSIKQSVTEPVSISNGEFSRIFRVVNHLLHDSHLFRLPDQYPESTKAAIAYVPAFYYLWMDGKLTVGATSAGLKKYVGTEVLEIDGMTAEEYVQKARDLQYVYDQDVESTTEEEIVQIGSFGLMLNTGANVHSRSHVMLADGTELDIPFVRTTELVASDNIRLCNRWKRVNIPASEDEVWSAKELNDSTSYLSISSFEMNDIQLNDCLDFLYNCKSANLIVDVRNNSGGATSVLMRLLSALTDVPMDRQKGGYSMVKKKGGFQSFKNCLNYSADEEIFPEYSSRKGEDGYFSVDTLETCSVVLPDTTGCYSGRIYVLTNGHSYSAATLFPSVLVRNRRGVTVGRETGSAYHFLTAYKSADIQMPNTRFAIRIPLVKCVFDTTVCERTPAGRGLLPDYPLPLSSDEILMGASEASGSLVGLVPAGEEGHTDVMLQYALSLIAEGKYLSADDPFAEADALVAGSRTMSGLIWIGGALALCIVLLTLILMRKRKANAEK